MKVSGFTLVRNGVKFEYPFLESIRSMLPLVDELIVNVGKGKDETLRQVHALAQKEANGKIKILESEWDLENPVKRKSGLILSEQTNIALDVCTGDWCLYLQADEVLHEEDYPLILAALKKYNSDPEVEGLLFDYVHFYGSFDVIQETRSAYRREVRMTRRTSGARSVGDAQSFRKADGSKLKVAKTGGRVFHYGWVRTPVTMKEKTKFMDSLYHGDKGHGDQGHGDQGHGKNEEEALPHTGENYRYKKFWGLKLFHGSHPKVMVERIKKKSWNWDFENSPFVFKISDLKKVVLDLLERATGKRFFEYRSYRVIK